MFTKWGEVQREQEFYWSSGLLHLPVGQGVVFLLYLVPTGTVMGGVIFFYVKDRGVAPGGRGFPALGKFIMNPTRQKEDRERIGGD